jgi:hypothetical protein
MTSSMAMSEQTRLTAMMATTFLSVDLAMISPLAASVMTLIFFNLGDGVDTIDDGAGVLGGGNDAIELGALRPNVLFTAEGEDLRIGFTQSAESVLVQGFLSADTSRHISSWSSSRMVQL